MNTDFEPNDPAVVRLEGALRTLVPRAASVDRDALMYRAGYAARQAAECVAPLAAPTTRTWALPTLVASVAAGLLGVCAGAWFASSGIVGRHLPEMVESPSLSDPRALTNWNASGADGYRQPDSSRPEVTRLADAAVPSGPLEISYGALRTRWKDDQWMAASGQPVADGTLVGPPDRVVDQQYAAMRFRMLRDLRSDLN